MGVERGKKRLVLVDWMQSRRVGVYVWVRRANVSWFEVYPSVTDGRIVGALIGTLVVMFPCRGCLGWRKWRPCGGGAQGGPLGGRDVVTQGNLRQSWISSHTLAKNGP